MKLERDLMKQISQRLGIYKTTGEIVWYHRIQSGQAKVGQYYIKLAESGTPDYFALIRGQDNGLLGLFIEAKSDTGQLRSTQMEFITRMANKKDIYILVMRHIEELDIWIGKYAKDYVKELPSEL